MKFAYTAYDRKGRPKTGLVEASSAMEATEELRGDGLLVEVVKATRDDSPDLSILRSRAEVKESTGGRRSIKGRGNRLKSVVAFTRQLSVLVGTGTPLVDALTSLEKQFPDPAWRPIIADVRRRVEEGSSLADAMEQHPRHFDTICRSLVAAGESGGNLGSMLDRLSGLVRQQLHVRSSLLGAMVYPVLLVVVALIVLVLLIGFVLPRFAGLFETLDMPLPPTTKFLMALSMLLSNYWWAAILAAIGSVVGGMFWWRSAAGRRVIHTVAVRAPQMGKIVRSLMTARMARLLGVLLQSKVPLLDALSLTRQASSNMHYEALLAKVEQAVTKGESISAALSGSDLVDASACEAIRNGERGGRIGDVLVHLADFMDEENEVVVRSLTSIMEPVILIVLGVLVAFVALSTFLPLFDLTSMTQTGS